MGNIDNMDLLMATVKASTEQAQGQIASTLRPLSLKTFRKASQDVRDPVKRGGALFRCWEYGGGV